jgi:hypothetical protein
MTLHAVQSETLAAVARFAEGLRPLSWFAAVGQELSTDERREAQDYLAAMGFLDASIETAPDWRAAEASTRDTQWSRTWWNAEERERIRLLDQAGKVHGQHVLLTALSRVTLAASDVVLGAASIAASRSGIADPTLARVAGRLPSGARHSRGGRRHAPLRHQVPPVRGGPLAAWPGRADLPRVLTGCFIPGRLLHPASFCVKQLRL